MPAGCGRRRALSCRPRRWPDTREKQEALPAAHIVTRHQTQPGRTARHQLYAGTAHEAVLQPHVHGIAHEPEGLQLALPPAQGKGGDSRRCEHDRVCIGRVGIYHQVQGGRGAPRAVHGHKAIGGAVQGGLQHQATARSDRSAVERRMGRATHLPDQLVGLSPVPVDQREEANRRSGRRDARYRCPWPCRLHA
jgi:hypothetical protein